MINILEIRLFSPDGSHSAGLFEWKVTFFVYGTTYIMWNSFIMQQSLNFEKISDNDGATQKKNYCLPEDIQVPVFKGYVLHVQLT